MRGQRRWLAIPVAAGVILLFGIGLRGGQADPPEPPAAEDVVLQWKPTLKEAEDVQQFWASPKDAPGVAASTFRAVGASFEDVWNHYADRCGIKDRYEAKRLLNSGGIGDRGSYVVADRASSDAGGGRGLSVFLLRTDRYTVTVTIRPDRDEKVVLGTIAAVTP